ncbi:MAG: hypothetical protein U9N52_07555 [Campylobacterota bacterium]|nr:hypothetical protein [Campylobacterota bacterium]
MTSASAQQLSLKRVEPSIQHCLVDEEVLFSCQSEDKHFTLCQDKKSIHFREESVTQFSTSLEETRGNSTAFSGGGAAWMTLRNGDLGTIAYTAIGKWSHQGDAVERSGILIQDSNSTLHHYKCSELFRSEIGPVWFEKSSIKESIENSELDVVF